MKSLVFLFCLILTVSSCFADVKSTNGVIKFDVNTSGQSEMILNSTGLGIGPQLTPSANLHVSGNAIISQGLSVGEASIANANLHISGTVGYSTSSVNTSGTISNSSLVFADTSNDNLILSLPYAGNVSGRVVSIKKTSSNHSLYLYGNGNLIDQSISYSMTSQSSSALPSVSLLSDGSQWRVLDSLGNVSASAVIPSANLLLWYDAQDSSTLTLSGDNVTQWSDKSGLGQHATQNTALKHPTYNSANTSIDFNGTSSEFDLSVPFSDNHTLIMVSKNNDGSEASLLNRHTSHYHAYRSNSTLNTRGSSPGVNSTDTLVDGQYYVIGFKHTGTGSTGTSYFINGSSSGNTDSILSSGSFIYMGSRGGSVFLNGTISEVLLYSDTLTSEEIRVISTSLMSKWDISN